MATAPVPFWAQPGNLLPSDLSKAREAFVERVNAAAKRAMRTPAPIGMPFRLIEASCFLAEAGVVAPPCQGETYFGWDLGTSRQYLDGLDPTARAAEIEAGREMMFEARHAICPDLATARQESAQVVDIMEARWSRQSAAYFARRDAEKAVAHG